jgi:hypothetical protein
LPDCANWKVQRMPHSGLDENSESSVYVRRRAEQSAAGGVLRFSFQLPGLRRAAELDVAR